MVMNINTQKNNFGLDVDRQEEIIQAFQFDNECAYNTVLLYNPAKKANYTNVDDYVEAVLAPYYEGDLHRKRPVVLTSEEENNFYQSLLQ